MPANVPTAAEFQALEQRVAKLETATPPTPIPPQPGTASPDGTVVLPGGALIDDGTGHKWGVTANAQVHRDGGPDTATSAVRRLGWYGGPSGQAPEGMKLVQENTAGGTWATPPVWPTQWVTCPSPFPGPPAARCADFVRSIGVNNHLGWDGTPHAVTGVVQASLAYLGVSLVRDAVPWSDAVAERYAQLSRAGIRWCLVLGPAGAEYTQTTPGELARAVAMGPSVVAIEGPNELNGQTVLYNGRSSSDPAVGRQIQQYTANSVRALASLAGKAVVNVSITIGAGGWEGYVAGLGDLSASCDLANWHTYFSQGDQPSNNIANNREYALQSAPGRPVIYTEIGYFTATQDASGWGGVDEATQAKNTLHILAAGAQLGLAQNYIYELLDSKANPSLTDIEARFGLFYSDGRPKPVAHAIHNLTTILADTGSSPAAPVGYTTTGLPAGTGHTLALVKGNGSTIVLIWNEAKNWDGANHRPIVVPPVNVTVSLSKPCASYVYDPVNSASAVASVRNPGSTVTLPLADRLQVLELVP